MNEPARKRVGGMDLDHCGCGRWKSARAPRCIRCAASRKNAARYPAALGPPASIRERPA
jgi:hypothetical protein